jgi:hypothetical protein
MKIETIGSEKVYLIILAISALVPFSIIVPDQFPFTGVSISFLVLSMLAFALIKQKGVYETILFMSSLLLSLFFILRANEFLLFLNTIALFYTNSLMILFSQKLETISAIQLIFSPLIVFFESLKITQPLYRLKRNKLSVMHIHEPQQHLFSILITLGILCIIIPLLSSANPLFSNLINNIASSLNMKQLFEILFSENSMMLINRFLMFLVLAVFLPRVATYISSGQSPKQKLTETNEKNTMLIIPKLVVGAVLFVFFVTQIQLYFSTEETLIALGYSHSQYAREVFAQLSLVVLIIFTLMYNDRGKTTLSRSSTYVLIMQAFFLSLMAFKSDFDYSSMFGFTYKRLWGFAGVFWIMGIITLFLTNYLKNEENRFLFIKQGALLSFITLLTVNIANFDYLIYHYSKARTESGIDHSYLSRLSPDSQSYGKHLTALMEDFNTSKFHSAQRLIDKSTYLREKYESFNDIRSFNLSEYRAYQEVKDIPLETYMEQLYPPQIPPVNQ